MSKLNHLFIAKKYSVIKHIRNGGSCNESLSEYTVVSALTNGQGGLPPFGLFFVNCRSFPEYLNVIFNILLNSKN